MKPVPTKCESRRLEVMRQRSELREGLAERLLRRVSPGALLVWSGFCVAATVILLSGSESMPWRLGQRLDQDVTARVSFEIDDKDRTDRERRSARETAPNVFSINDKVFSSIRRQLEEALPLATSEAPQAQPPEVKPWPPAELAMQRLRQYGTDEAGRESYAKLVTGLLTRLEQEYIVEPPSDPTRKDTRPPTTILRRSGKPDEYVSTDRLIAVADRKAVEKALQDAAAAIAPEGLAPWINEVVLRNICGPPDVTDAKLSGLWSYDRQATARGMDEAERSIPPFKTEFKARDLLVSAGTVLTGKQLDLLQQEHDNFLSVQKSDPQLRRGNLLRKLGMAGIVILISLGLGTYTVFYQDRIFNRPARSLGLAALILAMVLLSRLNERAQYPWDLPVEFAVGFVCIAAALLTIAYNQRFALGVCGSLAVLATLASRSDVGLFLTLITASSMMVFSLKEIRTRSKIVFAGLLAAVGALVASTSSGLIAGQEVKYVLVHAAAAAGAAMAAGFIVQGILPNFERMFGVATSMTLLEWCDASRPLLRRLAQEAPGTYSHSVILSQMADEAAETIGARGLLTRVGALYHDIGKIQKADYFVENQEARMNRHDRLSPTMSLLIIVGHVKDGVEMARAYGVPRVLHGFIAEHHGTTVVRYFHHAASEAAARNRGRHDREVPESEFRYPGPKPHSRETAILMICDGCEGAVRSLSEPTPGRIESTVHSVIMDRLNDGQFDECDITLRELKLVEQSLVKSLAAVHHGRIKYPKPATRDGSGTIEVPSESETPTPVPTTVRNAAEVIRQA